MQTYRLDKTREELFEEIFKHKEPPLPANVEVTLLVDGKSYGTLWILYNYEQKRYTFPVDPVLNALQGLVRRDLWEKLAQRAKAQSRFTVEDLIACGFPTVLNTSVFELSTGVPAQLLGTKIHPLSGQVVDPYTVPASEPSGFTAFLNTRFRDRLPYYQYSKTTADSLGRGQALVDSRNKQPRQPFITDLDGAVNLKTWVIEGKGSLLEKPKENAFEIRRQDFRLVHDWPRKSLRLTAGDLIFPTSGFQGFLKMGGLGFSRDFSLQPHLVAYPVKEFEFFLVNPSEVKVFINGVLRGTYQLDQGTHDLKGFPLAVGESEVEIQITDNTGQTQTLNFDFIHEPSLLAKGITAFSYNLGFPSRDVFNAPTRSTNPGRKVILDYEYDLDQPVFFLDFRRGMSNTLTMETYSQATDTVGMLGFGLLQAIRIGKIKADVAASYHHRDDFAWAGNLEYTYIPKVTANVSPVSWRIKSEYISKKFFRVGQDPTLLGALNMDASYQQYSQLINFSLGGSYTFRPDSADFYSISTGLSRNWPKGFASSLMLKNTFDRSKSVNTTVAASLNYFFNYDVQSYNASERIENHQPTGFEEGPPPSWDYSTELLWDYNGSATFPHNPVLNMSTSFGPTSNDYSARARWNGNQGIAQVMGRRYEPKSSYIISNYLDLSLQTTLLYADGNFALGRPVQNSFVMVKGIENEKECDILVNPNEMGYDAKARNWLPGVIPNVSPYYLKKIHLEALDPPLGSNDERTDFTIYPGYKSGYVFYLGSKSTIIALGTLLLEADKPAEYQSFQAIPLDGDSRDPISGFTNKVGKFQLTRMQPGKYRIEMYVEEKLYTTTLNLPKKSNGITTVGALLMSLK
jgi:outer membrane usher protein